MIQRLTVGLIDGDDGWVELIRQIGVSFERANWNEMTADRYSVVVVNRSVSRFEREALDAYARDGGAILDSGGYARAAGLATRARSIASVVGGDHPFESIAILDVNDHVQTLVGAQFLGSIVTLRDHNGGWLAHVPFDIATIMRANTSARRRFYSASGHHPDEEVARVPRSAYHDVLEGALRWLHAQRGRPFVHLWRFPHDHQSLFAYRIDSDYGTRANMNRLRDLAERYDIPLTLFLHVAAHVDDLDMFEQFGRHELAAHGYRHKMHDDYEANWGNIAEAVQVMRGAGMRPMGFAAPTGQWNPNLDIALRDLGLTYSSEFTLDYDGLPFHPWANGSLSTVLQIPVHPISAGALTRAHASENDMSAYFDGVIARQTGRRMPTILYHHPMQEVWHVVESVFKRARAEKLHATTLGEYATWWKRRHRIRLHAELSDGELRINCNEYFDDIKVRVEVVDGREAFLALRGDVRLAELPMNRPQYQPAQPPHDLIKIRRSTLSMLRHTVEDAVSRYRQ